MPEQVVDTYDYDNADIHGIENRMFPHSFGVIKLSGFWSPTTFNKYFAFCYKIYTLFCFSSIISLILTIIIDNAITEKSIRSLIENLYLILTVVNGMSKFTNIYIRRTRVIGILQRLMEKRWSNLQDDVENGIIKESLLSERYIARFCIYLVTMNNVSNALNPILHPDPAHDLMVDAYSPCDRSGAACFWTAYIYQVIGYVSTSLVHVGCDCLVFNFIDRICAHLRILEHRMLQMPDLVETELCQETAFLKDRIRDHHSICMVIKELSDTFYETVFVQFITSISILCTNIYLLSMQKLLSTDFLGVFVYLCCAFVQNFFYCWYGYKVYVHASLRSHVIVGRGEACDLRLSFSLAMTTHLSKAMFNMNWCILKKDTKQMLTFVMLKTSQNSYLFNSAIISLTPETFVKILKVSYSAFNILQQTSKK